MYGRLTSYLPTDLYFACFDAFAVVLGRVNVDYSTNYSTTGSTLVGAITYISYSGLGIKVLTASSNTIANEE
jgi:hypothetical protein